MITLSLGRDLFPGSDCLKGLTRERILPTEILAYNPDIACLQVCMKPARWASFRILMIFMVLGS